MSRRRPRRPNWSRREFLTNSAITGLALGVPGLLAGCGSDDDHPRAATPTVTPQATQTPTPLPEGPREDRTLHFDLSFAEVDDPRLCILRSSDDGLMLEPHTAESRAHFRDEDPLLRGVEDSRLTHFATEVDLPADALQSFWIMGDDHRTGDVTLLGLQLHVPEAVQRTLAAYRRASGQRRVYSAKVHAYGLQQIVDAMDIEELEPALDEFQTPWDTASALVFHHPEIMNLDLEQGPEIRKLIETLPCPPGADPRTCVPFLGTLADRIARHWPATSSGFTTFNGMQVPAWAALVALIDPDTGEPMVNSMGEPTYRIDVSDATVQAAQQTIRAVLRAIFDDRRFEGYNWHDLQGRTTTAYSFAAEAGGAGQAGSFKLVGDFPTGTSAHGLDFVSLRVADEVKRTVELQVRNWHLRTHALHVQFANQGGPLPIENKTAADTERSKLLGMVVTANTIMGIPAPFGVQTYTFEMPANASQAKLLFGSLGLGGDPFCPEALMGSIFTIVFNLAIPAVVLAAGIPANAKILTGTFVGTPRGVTTIGTIIRLWVTTVLQTSTPALARGIFGAAESGSLTEFFRSLLNLAANLAKHVVFPILAAIASEASEYALSNLAENAVGTLLLGGQILGNLATVAELTQTAVEVLASPALFTNQLTFQMTTTVRILPDPSNFRFPARARRYSVTLIYDEASTVAHEQTGDVMPGQVDPIPVVFAAVPSGGHVTVDVILTTEEGYIIGRGVDEMGTEGPIGPRPNTPAQAETISVPIKERLIPLSQSTTYLHDLELKYQDGQRAWVQGPAPTATSAVLCQGQDDRLCTLGGITINQRTGMAGYSFSAGGQGDRRFCGENAGGVMHLFQNVFLGDDPERALKTLSCGFHSPAGIVYERLGPATGRHFFLEPTQDGTSYFLESVVLDTTTPFTLNNPLAWGRFTQALVSLAVVPTGYVVGVSRLNHKMEILELPAAPVDRSVAPQALPFAVQKAGEGTREGLLNAPVALAVFGATILVLETGNARIQAFDVSGNPVRLFRNGTRATIELESGPTIQYLDIAVEALGYMYVLSSTNGGQTVNDYRLDIFTPQGNRLARTIGVAAARLAVDTFRSVYTLNFGSVVGAPRVEPSLSQWVPSTPAA